MAEQPPLTEEQAKALQEKLKSMSPEELAEFQKQQCIFCQIVAGKVPVKKVYETEYCIAILDINPATKGHVLIIPKVHYAIMPQVPDQLVSSLFLVSKYVSQAILKSLKAAGTSIFVANGPAAGQKAQHFMIHVIPRAEGDGILAAEEHPVEKQNEVAAKISNTLYGLLGIKKEIINVKGKDVKGEDVKEAIGVEDEKSGTKANKTAHTGKAKKSRKARPKIKEQAEDAASPDDVSLDDIADLFK